MAATWENGDESWDWASRLRSKIVPDLCVEGSITSRKGETITTTIGFGFGKTKISIKLGT